MVKTECNSCVGFSAEQAVFPDRFLRRRRAAPWKTTVSLAIVSLSSAIFVSQAAAFLPPNMIASVRSKNQRLMYRNVVTDPDSLLLETFRSSQRDDMEKLFHASRAEVRPKLDEIVVHRGVETDMVPSPSERRLVGKIKSGRGIRGVVNGKKRPALTVSSLQPKRSRSSTMAGFVSKAEREKLNNSNESPEAIRKHRKSKGEALYKNNPSVPDSLVQFAKAIHNEDRISRIEEIELGEKTQEAIRLQNLYDVLERNLGREPTDEEWCAAAGKINMESICQTIEEGIEAKNKLVTANLRLVQSVVNTYLRNGLSTQYNAGDLMQDGIVALIRAAEKFEPDRGWKFSTYAMYWVRASVKNSQIYQSRVINVPQRLHENYKRLRRLERAMAVETGRRPTEKELGEAVGMTEKQVQRCFTAVEQRCFSLDQEISNSLKPGSDSNGETLVEIIAGKIEDSDHLQSQRVLLREDLIETLQRYLTREEVDILLLRYGLKEAPNRKKLNGGQQVTIAELSRIFGLKPDKVRRTIDNSLKQLESAGLEEWLSFERELR